MKPKWLTKTESQRTQSDRKVKALAKKTGGRVVANSGATPWAKGDIRYAESLLEHKFTHKKSFKLDEQILSKHYKDAVKAGKDADVMIEFNDYYLVGRVFKK